MTRRWLCRWWRERCWTALGISSAKNEKQKQVIAEKPCGASDFGDLAVWQSRSPVREGFRVGRRQTERQRSAVWSKEHVLATPSKFVPGEVSIARASVRTVEADGLRIFYTEAGPEAGPVVLLLHGFPSSSHMFRELIPRLATRYRVIAPDLPGCGFTRVPEERECGDPAGSVS